jgi:hypothetical protein
MLNFLLHAHSLRCVDQASWDQHLLPRGNQSPKRPPTLSEAAEPRPDIAAFALVTGSADTSLAASASASASASAATLVTAGCDGRGQARRTLSAGAAAAEPRGSVPAAENRPASAAERPSVAAAAARPLRPRLQPPAAAAAATAAGDAVGCAAALNGQVPEAERAGPLSSAEVSKLCGDTESGGGGGRGRGGGGGGGGAAVRVTRSLGATLAAERSESESTPSIERGPHGSEGCGASQEAGSEAVGGRLLSDPRGSPAEAEGGGGGRGAQPPSSAGQPATVSTTALAEAAAAAAAAAAAEKCLDLELAGWMAVEAVEMEVVGGGGAGCQPPSCAAELFAATTAAEGCLGLESADWMAVEAGAVDERGDWALECLLL